MEKKAEQRLIQLSLKGDESAFAALIRPYKSRIHSLCWQVLHDQERAEDLTQETFIHAFRHLSEFRQEARFYTWIYRIALNLSLNALRKKKVKEREDLVADLGKETRQELWKKGNTLEFERHELQQFIDKAVQTLPSSQRDVFILHDIEGLPHQQIAERLNIKPGTIRSRLHYARKRLRTYLREYLTP